MAGLQVGVFGASKTWPMVKPRIVRSPIAGQVSALGSAQTSLTDPRKRLELEAMQLQLDQARQRGAGEAAEAAIRQKMQTLALQQQQREFERSRRTRSAAGATISGGGGGGGELSEQQLAREAERRERESGSELETAALQRRLASELSGQLGGLLAETGGDGTAVAEADELQIRDRLARLLAETEQPVDVRGDPRTAQFRLAQQRAEERGRTQLAGRAEAEGWGSGEIEAERRKLAEARGEAEAGYEAGLYGQLGQERFARLSTALEQGRALQEARSERALRQRMARLAARTQAIGMVAPIVRL